MGVSMQNTPLIRILFCFAVHPHPSRLSHGSYVMFKKIGSDSHDLLDSPLSVSCNLAARVGAQRIRARYQSLKLPSIYGFGERRLEGGSERWPQRQLSFRRFALAVNRMCRAEGGKS